MEGILKMNEIPTIGGVTPQGDDVKILGNVNGWVVVEVADSAISSLQEFNIQPVESGFAEAITGPRQEGAYNSHLMQVTGFGDKMRIELNPGQTTPDGTPIVPPSDKDDRTKKNYTVEDVEPYQNALAWVKKFDSKSVLRNQIRGNIADIEDDIADTKVATQMALYYFAHEWNSRTEEQKNANQAKENMNMLVSKLLSDDVKMRSDLKDGMEKICDILEKEEKINALVSSNYIYNAGRGV